MTNSVTGDSHRWREGGTGWRLRLIDDNLLRVSFLIGKITNIKFSFFSPCDSSFRSIELWNEMNE